MSRDLCRCAFFHLRRLRSVRRQLGQDVMERLVCALVLSRLDYCNVVLAGLRSPSIDSGTVTACPVCGSTSRARPQATCMTTSVLLCENYIGCQSVNELCTSCVFSSTRHQSPDYIIDIPASHCYFIAVLTTGRQSRRLCRAMDEPENGRSSIFHCCTASVELAAD